ncbi:hypothetical protein RBB50_003866 [Rhinocladiella similis]
MNTTSERFSITSDYSFWTDSPLPQSVQSPLAIPKIRQGTCPPPRLLKSVSLSSPEDLLPDFEVGLCMMEIYFARFFAGSLIFDRQKLLVDYRAGRVSPKVTMSMFAVVSLLLRPKPDGKQGGYASISLPDGQGKAWAEAASRLTLADADKPSLDNIRACELLGFYWWAVGEVERVVFYLSVSRQSLRILKKKLYSRFRTEPYDLREMRRLYKLRQACWIKASLIDSDESYPEASVRLFSRQFGESETWEQELNNADQNSEPDIDPNDWLTWDDVRLRNCGTCCVRLFLLWRQIRNLVRQTWNSRSAGYMTTVFEYDSKLEQFYRTIPPELRSKDVMNPQYPERRRRNAFLLNSIYYLCAIYLHASTVPGFSGKGTGLDISANLAEFCARTALLNANLFAEMARAYLATRPDFSKVPSFVGYCAFIAGSVHAVMLRLRNGPADWSWRHSIMCLLILQELKFYFPIMTVFWRDLKAQIEANSGERLSMQDITIRNIIFSSSSTEDETRTMPPVNNSLFEPANVQDPFILRCYLPMPQAPDDAASESDDEETMEVSDPVADKDMSSGSGSISVDGQNAATSSSVFGHVTGVPFDMASTSTMGPTPQPFQMRHAFGASATSPSEQATSLSDGTGAGAGPGTTTDPFGYDFQDANVATNFLTSADLFGLPSIAPSQRDPLDILLEWEI